MSNARVVMVRYPLQIPKTYYAAVGEMIAVSALFEYHLMDAIAQLIPIDDPKKKRITLLNMSVKPKIGILRALINYYSPTAAIKSELLEITKHGLELIQWRHNFAHGIWGHESNKKPSAQNMRLTYVPESKDAILPKSTPLKSAQVLTMANSMRNLTNRLLAVIDALQVSRAP